MRLKTLAQHIQGNLIGNADDKVDQLAPIFEDCKDKLTFVLEKKYLKYVVHPGK